MLKTIVPLNIFVKTVIWFIFDEEILYKLNAAFIWNTFGNL